MNKETAIKLVSSLVQSVHNHTLAVNTHTRLSMATAANREHRAAEKLLAAICEEPFTPEEVEAVLTGLNL